MNWWRWFQRAEPAVYVEKWNPVIAEQHAANTARMLLGWCGPAKVVGNRIVEAREARVRQRRNREQFTVVRKEA